MFSVSASLFRIKKSCSRRICTSSNSFFYILLKQHKMHSVPNGKWRSFPLSIQAGYRMLQRRILVVAPEETKYSGRLHNIRKRLRIHFRNNPLQIIQFVPGDNKYHHVLVFTTVRSAGR
ncbi:hypothetical protein SAMN05216244_1454 [Sediminibacillus halophilus]|uniref:Uncharacterized protein n=1 Tax=Sediminibacillus halophilus TaxID=482461 RepID=A0A1G9PL44_9BACI|nr:hypothetical protein SAMN05216244_1454 [Sediminibacillus halophilus]